MYTPTRLAKGRECDLTLRFSHTLHSGSTHLTPCPAALRLTSHTHCAHPPVLRKGVMALECHASHCSGDGSAQLPGSTSAMRLPRRCALVPSEGSRMRPPWGAPAGRGGAGKGLRGE